MGLNPEDGHELRVLPRFADGELGTIAGDDGRIGAKSFAPAVTRADGVEPEWRDAAEVTGWAVACACAQLNTGGAEATPLGTFDRARTPDEAVEGIAYYAGTYDEVLELGDSDSAAAHAQILWDGHLAELATMRELRQVARRARDTQIQLDFYVDLARGLNKSWTEIGAATGLSRQGARQRWADKVRPAVEDDDDLTDRIQAIYSTLAGEPGAWVSLTALRAALADVPRGRLDLALLRLAQEAGVTFNPDPDPTTLTPEDRDATLHLGGQGQHLIAIGAPPEKRP